MSARENIVVNNVDQPVTTDWHALDNEAVLTQLNSSEKKGLSQSEVLTRQQNYGLNRLPAPPKKSLLQRFLLQFHNILIYVLMAAGVTTAILNHWIDTAVIAAVVIVNAIIGVVQEGKAEKALDAIRNMLSHQAMVKRDGAFVTTPAEQLVPGDIVTLQSGDKIPADIRLVNVHDLRVDEAILTGESLPNEKHDQAMSSSTVVADRANMAYSGTLVTYGHAVGVVVATGEHTEIGRINKMLSDVETLETPLIREVDQLAKWLTFAVIILASFTFMFGVWVHDYSPAEMFLAAVGLAVAAIPEGLPAIMTITLAIGVQQMAKRSAVIRRLPAVETLGSVSIICSDKTGTLTRNEMTVRNIQLPQQAFEVTGSGYDPHGSFQNEGQEVDCDQTPALQELVRAVLLCNDATLIQKEGAWQLAGDPTEGALITLAMKAGLDPNFEKEEYPRTDIIPFESEHRFMATLHHDHKGHAVVYLKGAPERVLEMCQWQRHEGCAQAIDQQYWLNKMQEMAAQGQRVLAIASKAVPVEHIELNFDDVGNDLCLLGLVAMIDPPREEATAAVKLCHTAGIRVKMITGDHVETAKSIGAQMGIGDGTKALTGVEIERLSDEQLQKVVLETDVFARTSPEHKLRLVTALQATGRVVAMTGDGVNDAPALRRADVGIAMGINGTEVSKEAAEMVLADDNFATIARAVEEGRTVYDNLKKAILFILPTNAGEALSILAAILLGKMLPITPVQILWVNMITAVTLALALAFEPAEKNVMSRPPRDPKAPLLSGFLVWRSLFVGLILVTGTFGLFLWYREAGASLEYARTIAVNTLVMFEIFYLFSTRYFLDSVVNKAGIFGNRIALYAIGVLLVFQMLFTYTAPMQSLFSTTAISLSDWALILLVSSSVFVIVELEKLFLRSRQK
ncbi:plasma-membrane calcium-translocating P-type ATPase/potassium and/or sodium efflux P-type ATPase,TIGR01523 [Oceanospirillum multiglobuliferum]|uniref:Carbonate dehydratase n=1 Tax=Oceanospirillum multiglobuliferum TaxID=64969 RepID=A0A1T4RCT7_9GAMM|nr:cation-transporting P-type ATPase [Oceanospirillum multiglobuliferum]OPX55189.1 carbonate dehydratase [Oceanospirillum multiglobuliferum]SKA13739.1 plasma-membrane calcium-translocating P-type ATPase/potassium and/or sodium efflux P-type ATPase,TIGR01523 [Oceanospirillum multiglobuliferum]